MDLDLVDKIPLLLCKVIMKNKNNIFLTFPNNNFLSAVERKLKVKFKNIYLLKNALVHKSYTYIAKEKIDSNEKLELLGDSVLSLIVLEFLYKKYQKTLSEGEISKKKAFIVSKDNLCNIAKKLNLGTYLLIGKGERLSEANKKHRILCDVLEAIIGAYYLDSGYKKVYNWIIPHIIYQLKGTNATSKDYKTILQVIVQRKYQICPTYIVQTEKGLDHQKTFYVKVHIKNQIFGKGHGKSKKIAEKNAALQALLKIKKNSTFL